MAGDRALQKSSPAIVAELHQRLKERNRVHLASVKAIKTQKELKAELEKQEADDLFSTFSLSWYSIGALVVLGILYTYISVFNTSFGYAVPTINVIVLMAATLYALKSMGED